MVSKSTLAIELSKLQVFENAKFKQEQHPTDSEIAAEALWNAFMKGNIEDKIIADLGCGTGILGIGCLMLGAKKVYFVENDPGAIASLKGNLRKIDVNEYKIFEGNINKFNKKVDVIVQNPPFGTKEKHADREFLLKAFNLTYKIYTFHKTSTSAFVEKISAENKFKIKDKKNFKFPLKNTMPHHKTRIKRIDVSLFVLEKIK
ncbi:MAG: METTL5 family protein [Nanoarchaeota archaeon]